jgi:hypothetical protein
LPGFPPGNGLDHLQQQQLPAASSAISGAGIHIRRDQTAPVIWRHGVSPLRHRGRHFLHHGDRAVARQRSPQVNSADSRARKRAKNPGRDCESLCNSANSLKTMLAPVCAKTPTQQAEFYRQFEAWRASAYSFNDVDDPTPAAATSGPAVEVMHKARARAYVTVTALVILAVTYPTRPEDIAAVGSDPLCPRDAPGEQGTRSYRRGRCAPTAGDQL